MIYLVLTNFFSAVVLIVPGVITLIRAAGSPGGKPLLSTGGGLLVLAGLVDIGWQFWFRLAVVGPIADGEYGAAVPFNAAVATAYHVGRPLLIVVAVVLLLAAVFSTRGKPRSSTGTPAPLGYPQTPHAQEPADTPGPQADPGPRPERR